MTSGGGDYRNRTRFAVEVVRTVRTRSATTSLLSTGCRCSTCRRRRVLRNGRTGACIQAAGATIINTGIGWHEARIPTIATPVPRGAFTWVTRKLEG
ncbi:hypothetical protein ACLK1S_19130 [Escherichia coli]